MDLCNNCNNLISFDYVLPMIRWMMIIDWYPELTMQEFYQFIDRKFWFYFFSLKKVGNLIFCVFNEWFFLIKLIFSSTYQWSTRQAVDPLLMGRINHLDDRSWLWSIPQMWFFNLELPNILTIFDLKDTWEWIWDSLR